MCFSESPNGEWTPVACTPCTKAKTLPEPEKRNLADQRSWREILASQVSSQFDILGVARVAPEPEDYQNHGHPSFPSILVHTRDHLHADGRVRIHGIRACQLDLRAIPRIATRIVDHLMRIDAHQAQLSELVKNVRKQVIQRLEDRDGIVFRGVFIDEVNFIEAEHSIFGRPMADIYVVIRYAVKGIAALPSNDHTTLKCQIGQKPSMGRFDRAIERLRQTEQESNFTPLKIAK